MIRRLDLGYVLPFAAQITQSPRSSNLATFDNRSVFATGAHGTSGIDSLTTADGSVWAEYGNGADTTGAGGSSTLVRYSSSGTVEQTIKLAGSVDGLKYDPANGQIYALQNQDGNSTLTLTDAETGKVGQTLSFATTSAARGYDDAVFLNGKVYLSYTNPNGSGDPVVQQLTNGNDPFGKLTTTDVLADGAMGLNIADGKMEAIPLNDPDSLKSTPTGGLVLSSGSDNTIVFIDNPGAANQSERFVTLTGLPAGSSVDDVIIPTSSSGTFTVSNAGTNQIEKIHATGLNTSDAYASVGSEIVQVDLQTGATTAVVTGLARSHGLIFTPETVKGPTVQSTKIFAVGREVNAKAPDSVTVGKNGTTFVEYGNGVPTAGTGGGSTIVEYSKTGQIEKTFSLPGSGDGLKIDPMTGKLWVLQNQDGNSTLTIIDPTTGKVGAPLNYAVQSSTRGYDDVAFTGGKVYLSHTNPAATGDSVLERLDNGNTPSGVLTTTSILRLGDTGTNLLTGQVNQAIPLNDPDSLKSLADGTLALTSGNDATMTFIRHPGTDQQTASFIVLPAGTTGLDDAIIPQTSSGTFVVSNQNANDVIKVAVAGLNPNDIYASIGGDNAVDQIDPKTGMVTPIITGLNSPHGLAFIPSGSAGAITPQDPHHTGMLPHSV
jgi:DNA-binding beta-propeller fold protein YncE